MSIEEVISLIDDAMQDSFASKNVRNTLEEAKKKLLSKNEDLSLRVSSAVYSIEKTVEDPNIVPHIRIKLLNILSALETVKE